MAEQLTTWLLWTMAALGLWNSINLAARLYYREPSWRYVWHIFSGAWASLILWLR